MGKVRLFRPTTALADFTVRHAMLLQSNQRMYDPKSGAHAQARFCQVECETGPRR